jgi:predicted DNA-binding protein (UPF0251 family)
MFYISSNHTFTLPKDYKFEIGGNFFSGGLESAFLFGAGGSLNLGIQKTILNKRGTIRLNVQDILNLIEKLDEEEKVVFNLFEIDGYSHKEIAKDLEVSERSSKRYLASARVNLRKMITQIFETVNMILL